jgi:peptidoglycan/xylan/chitin deacetylase (PgdA/CDA1 family)
MLVKVVGHFAGTQTADGKIEYPRAFIDGALAAGGAFRFKIVNSYIVAEDGVSPLYVLGAQLGEPAPPYLRLIAVPAAPGKPFDLTFAPIPNDAGAGANVVNLNVPDADTAVIVARQEVESLQTAKAQALAALQQNAETVQQIDYAISTLEMGLGIIGTTVAGAQDSLSAVQNAASLLPAPPVKNAAARDAYFAAHPGDGSVTQMDLSPPHVYQRENGIVSDLGPVSLATPSEKPNLRPAEIGGLPRPPRRPLIVLRFDDGFDDDYYTVRPLLASKNVKATFGIVYNYIGKRIDTVDYMNTDKIFALVGDGHEIASHTTNHDDLTTLAYDALDAQLRDNVAAMKALGFNVSTLIYPYNAHNSQVRTLAKKYFRGALAGGYYTAVPPLPTYMIPSREFVQGAALSLYQGWVDDAVAKNGVLTILIHSRFGEFDATQRANLASMIDYAKAQGCQFVTASQMFDIMGNQAEWGDFPNGVTGGGFDRDGKFFGAGGGLSQLAAPNFKTSAAGIQDYDAGKITVFDFNPSGNGAWPYSAGTVTTNRIGSAVGHLSGGGNYQWEFQEARDYYSGAVSIRLATGLGTWSAWSSSEAVVAKLSQNGGSLALTAASGRTAYASGKITEMTVTGNGWPYGAASVVTDRTAGGDASGGNTMWDRQIAYDFYSENVSIRRATSDSTWSAWVQQTNNYVGLPQNGGATLINGNSGRTAFASGRVSHLSFTAGSSSNAWPCNVGSAITYRMSPDATTGGNVQWDRQEVYDYYSDAVWQRRALTDSTWTPFVRMDPGGVTQTAELVQDTTYRATTPVTAFPVGKMIFTQLLPAQISADTGGVYPAGATDSGGTLVTETVTTANGSARSWTKQFFWYNNSSRMAWRAANYDGTTLTWGTWYTMVRGLYNFETNLTFGTIAAGAESVQLIGAPNVTPGDTITAFRKTQWYDGLHVVRADCFTAGTIRVVVRNFSATAITDAGDTWVIKAHR